MAKTSKNIRLTNSELKNIAIEISGLTIKDIMSSQQSLNNFIAMGKRIIKAQKKKSKETNEELSKTILTLFNLITQIRQFFTGEEYYLLVETENMETVGVPLKDLFANSAFTINKSKIEYNLSTLQNELKKIDTYETMYRSLVQRLFPQCNCDDNAEITFLYQHTKRNNLEKGHFFDDNHFAHYKARNTYIYNFYVETRQKNFVYTKETAKFYNRGHVYEWYLDDLNKEQIKSNQEVDPVAFMRRHKKDTVPFMQAGDITVQKGEQIYAVQIKRFNNHKLITYNQIETVLNQLQKLTNPNITKKDLQTIVTETFLSEKQEPIQKQTVFQVEETVSNLTKIWNVNNELLINM